MLLGTLGASLLGNLLTRKGILRAGSGIKKGKEILRAGSRNKKVFHLWWKRVYFNGRKNYYTAIKRRK